MKPLWAALSGALFGAGLVVSGMTRPDKVIGFLDVAGDWDPTLAFVMGGAVLVHAPLRWWVSRRESPMFEATFERPASQTVTVPLVVGAALFGAGWGLSGFCPGPALTSVGGSYWAIVFTAGLAAGMGIHHVTSRLFDGQEASSE